jgi:HK97 gp10 family phage protein
MTGNSVQITGLDEFIKELTRLKEAAASEKMLDGLEAGARVIQAHMQNNVREKLNKHPTGFLANSIAVKREGKFILVGTFGVVYAAIQEFGGVIAARAKPFLTFQIDGKWIRKKVVHITARPWARPAVDENKDEIFKAIADALRGLLGM